MFALINIFLAFKFQPSVPYFAPDNATYYKVFSDTEGYKHIHYINGTEVSYRTITADFFSAGGQEASYSVFCLAFFSSPGSSTYY